MRRNVSWRELNPMQRVAVAVLGCIQVGLAIVAWRDLAKRPAAEVNGNKRMWAAIIAINWVGPLAYFAKGRRA
jgi:Phospholipase_D-nuclease N-terminal